ncbi:hypothetical protein NBRC10513_003751 [Rhodotorula toruloides]
MSLFRSTASFAMSAAHTALSIAFCPARLGYRCAVAVVIPLYSSPSLLTDSCDPLPPLDDACDPPADFQLAVASCDEVQHFASTPPDALFPPKSASPASTCSPVSLNLAPIVTDESLSEPSPPSPPLSLASSIASRPSSPVFDEPALALPVSCALPRSFAYQVKADALEAWLVLNFVRLPTGAAHAAARAHGLARIDMEESYELALDIAWNATKFQEDEYDRVARLKYRMMRVMDDYLDHSQGHKKRRGPAHTRPKMQHTPKLYSFPTLSAEFTFVSLSDLREELDLPLPPSLTRRRRFATHRSSHRSHRSRSRSRSRSSTRSYRSRPQTSDLQMRVRLNEAWKVDRQNAPQRLERLRKMVLQNQELAKRYQEAAGMAGREEAPASAVNGGVDVVNLTPETAVVCSDWRLALEEDDNEYFAAPPVFDS